MQVTKIVGTLALFVSAAAAVTPRVVQIDKRGENYGGKTPPNSPALEKELPRLQMLKTSVTQKDRIED
ncbi:hypothetical protein CCM_07388 [Cordyceps militaris CM01]|uniref:Uncharacterized protein n=1 Tax=Cordyceps militaris (strain CM01) TaxID=983644 RepID=G3JPN5_CORMM|nr:uncharacterized protein CCM_07388 [Cordyceps militaris CM01]EGX89136.1 hypothetical protein CCM_07388 [Cordyceps militaris CM01]